MLGIPARVRLVDRAVTFLAQDMLEARSRLTVGELISASPRSVWKPVRGEIASERRAYFDAFGHQPLVHAIQLTRPRRVDPFTPRFVVGQGWRFLDARRYLAHRSIVERIKRSR
jgi:hypothetical protein